EVDAVVAAAGACAAAGAVERDSTAARRRHASAKNNDAEIRNSGIQTAGTRNHDIAVHSGNLGGPCEQQHPVGAAAGAAIIATGSDDANIPAGSSRAVNG